MTRDPNRFYEGYDPEPPDLPHPAEYDDREPPDEDEPEDNVPDAVADPEPQPEPVRYRDHDGTLVAFMCGVCRGPVTSLTDPDGWTRWSCPCGRTEGIAAPVGALDLGIIRQVPDAAAENNFALFEETFEGYVTTRLDKVTDLVRSEGDTDL